MIESLLTKYLGVSKFDDQYRHLSLTLISIVSCTGVAAFFAFYNSVIDYYPSLFYVDLAGTLLGIVSLYIVLRFQRVLLASFILLIMVTGVCLMVMLDRHNLDYSLAWAFVTPLLSIFLLGYLYGTLYSMVYLAVVLWLAWSNLGVWQPAPWDMDSFANLTAIYLLLFMLSCYYEASRRSAQKLLQQSNQKLKVLATTDPLTGLFNRRYMEDLLLNSNQNVFVAMADVDNFKSINDEFGHSAGDEVLIGVGHVMGDTFGLDGVIGRWGGEEFLIVSYAQNSQDFEKQLALLLERISSHSFSIERPVTISLGGVHYKALEHRATLRAVDEALYRAKTSGKNCYKLVGDP
ncbi:GGDEF domain-containing protein [Maribrevibacterium harenarium]|uniref:diguanylate cyclase n=1 Tax=Maribrevibacterium harenarium TaxID=2589817 RepID=A0A501WLK8_9GAMM|nr:GGDEF domain-containing protein [Maribrevibacterium harenarium]TPE47931.1 GGDEF domain-containing protein [Maribrevibacterium harenarium]